MDTSPTSRGVNSTHERTQSPATSFLQQFARGASLDDRPAHLSFTESRRNLHGQEHRDEGYENRRSGDVGVSNTLKRSAASPVEEPQHQEAIKRPCNNNHSPHLQAKYNHRRCADAATQTEIPETASAKLASLQEEEVAAKAKHEAQMAMAQARYETEVARRRQIMAEVEYQSKMAAWRQLSEVSSSKESTTPGPTATGSASGGTSDPARLQNFTGKTAVEPLSPAKERVQSVSTKAKAQEAPKAQPPKTQQVPKGETSTANQHEIVQSPPTPKRLPDTSSKVNGPVKRTIAPDTSKANGPVKGTTVPDTSKAAPSSPPHERPRERADTSKSHSVQIKTSRSPPSKPRARPQTDIPWAPSSQLKHLTCYFWKNTAGCNKSAEQCNYAHFNTGVTASDPEHLRRYKRW
ncbi:MAG: hypothetical protein L6R38_006160 [Xanthoria sp. 2 TBL-2021]|nr:MAG: hypothetical protein L6R38_006160 [Xanthoria sp. 2 TBL-2021]